MSEVFNFKSIGRKLSRLEQKAEFEEKNPPVVWSDYQQMWVAVPFIAPETDAA